MLLLVQFILAGKMLPLEVILSYKDQKHFIGLVYPDDYMMKNLKIDALRNTRDDGVKCYAKFKFMVAHPENGENKKIKSDVELKSAYEGCQIRKFVRFRFM